MRKAAAIYLVLVLPSGPAIAQGTAAPTGEPAAESWIVSETTSPLDYAPVIVASALSNDRASGSVVQLSIQCRRGRTNLVIASPALTGRPEERRVSYTVNDGRPVTLPSGPATSGTGISIGDDVARLLTALPGRGEIVFQVAVPQATPLQARYALGPLKTVLERMVIPCKWLVTAPATPKAPPQ
jgi:hypothetical protein